MVLPARVGEEPREISHALEIAHVDGVALVDHGPVVAFATKDVEAPSRLLIECVAGRGGHRRVHRRRRFNPFEDRARGSVLQDGLVLAAADAVGFGED